jgi:hypothetical protein
MLDDLSSEQIEQLITDHWRELKGLLKELKRRRVSQTNNEPLDSGYRDGRVA